ncbi:hypothetical protein BBBOND_0304820 [Babesia bigemina]|uniref:Uncharacterized protein n=1 Tax=Babesia bigemina TaxID=5866 RepID=A0A061DC91_BABBI|nr:hypothetical protein BBBOND_0304820 [Babesia bigemina]CDR96579.1 hypothetical protein BBBOND_0304820 [Babesia bigemina]|eukprot:XP_012768765.1 hypothetical protein BBBOND_0304820 [Babesia bigemina]
MSSWLRGLGGEDDGGEGCKKKTKECPDFKKCGCECCKQKCDEQADKCKPQAPPSRPGPQDSEASPDESFRVEAQIQEDDSPPFRPDPEAIAAVIVAIIVAIILLDLCIFRFPVGRNIRDFLVRKIPFCIAFYS